MLSRCRPSIPRNIYEFAEREVITPNGAKAGMRWNPSAQPWQAKWFGELARGWRRAMVSGPGQCGKTFAASVVPLAYYLFELSYACVFGLPDERMWKDKWSIDLCPAFDAMPSFRARIPTSGRGSRGGLAESVDFGRGARLRAMTGGGGSTGRFGYTAPIVIITEADGIRAEKIAEMETRANSYRAAGMDRTILESTPTTNDGTVSREWRGGTGSYLVSRCVGCAEWVAPGRDDLRGWRDAESDAAAARAAHFACPRCRRPIGDAEREAMVRACKLVHRGQRIDGDNVVGPVPDTDTFALRVTAFDNLFVSAAALARREWQASRMAEAAEAERITLNLWWGLPYVPPEEAGALDAAEVAARMMDLSRGEMPSDCDRLSVGIDVGRRYIHWAAVCRRSSGASHVVDYGVEACPLDGSPELAIRGTLADLVARLRHAERSPDWVWVDAGYEGQAVYAACRETKTTATKGMNVKQTRSWGIGQLYAESRVPDGPNAGMPFIDVHADRSKMLVHDALDSGQLTVFGATTHKEHIRFARHLLAETVTQTPTGPRWTKRGDNHWLDAVALAMVANTVPRPTAAASSATPAQQGGRQFRRNY